MPKNIDHSEPSSWQVKVPLWPHLITPTAGAGLWVATAGGHLWWDTPVTAGFAAAGLTLAGGALTGLTWRAAAARGVVRRYVATLATGAGSVWTIGATLAAPWSRPWLDAWVLGTVTASVAMSTIRVLRDGRPTGEHDGTADGGLGEAVKSLKGARIGRATIDGARAVAQVSLEPGTAVSELAGDRAALASALDVPTTAVRVVPNPDSARRGRIDVVPVDQLRQMIPWPGLSAPGRSIAEAIALGIMEDGEPLLIWFPGDHSAGRNANHYLVVGMSGAGKTEVILNICAEVLSRPDAELWLADPRKFDQLPRWAVDGAARTASTEEATNALLEDLYADIATRARQIGAHQHKQWTAGCDRCPTYRVAIIDEAAQVAAGNPLVTELTEAARSAGISLVFGLQRASHDRFPTSARSNISGSICLGVDSATDAEMALTDATLDAGAAPWEWKNTKPGYLYAEVPGTDPERWIMPCRSFVADEKDRAAAVAPFTGQQPTTQQPTAPAGPAPDGDTEEDTTTTTAPRPGVNPDEPPDDVDPAQPIAVPPGIRRIAFGELRKPPMGAEEAREWLRQYVHDLHDAGAEAIKPSELSDVMEATGKGADWVRKEMGRLCTGDDAILRHTSRGVYRIRIPEPV
jgi:hypothetical protein